MTARIPATGQAQVAARRVHGAPPGEAIGYAGLVTRAIAFAIDAALINLTGVVVGGVVALVFSLLPGSDELNALVVATGGAVFVIWVVGYFLTFWTTTGETPGDRVMRIRVVRADGTALRPRHALVRLVGIIASALPLFAGFVPILVTPRRRGLHDFLAGTVVQSRMP